MSLSSQWYTVVYCFCVIHQHNLIRYLVIINFEFLLSGLITLLLISWVARCITQKGEAYQ